MKNHCPRVRQRPHIGLLRRGEHTHQHLARAQRSACLLYGGWLGVYQVGIFRKALFNIAKQCAVLAGNGLNACAQGGRVFVLLFELLGAQGRQALQSPKIIHQLRPQILLLAHRSRQRRLAHAGARRTGCHRLLGAASAQQVGHNEALSGCTRVAAGSIGQMLQIGFQYPLACFDTQGFFGFAHLAACLQNACHGGLEFFAGKQWVASGAQSHGIQAARFACEGVVCSHIGRDALGIEFELWQGSGCAAIEHSCDASQATHGGLGLHIQGVGLGDLALAQKSACQCRLGARHVNRIFACANAVSYVDRSARELFSLNKAALARQNIGIGRCCAAGVVRVFAVALQRPQQRLACNPLGLGDFAQIEQQ